MFEALIRNMRSSCRGSALAVLATLPAAFFACATPLRAQDASLQNQLYQRMVANPLDHDLTFEFARVATERGDYEAAVGALERLLYYNPRLTRVKYELGALYFRLRAFDLARRYFKEALASPDLDPGIRQRILAYLPDAEKQNQPSRFSAFVQSGFRTQTNASYAPNTGLVRLNGVDLNLQPNARQRSDVNWFGLGGVAYDYDLDPARGTVLETRGIGYGTQQQQFGNLNVGLFDLSVGPRFFVAPAMWPGVTIKPYVTGGNIWIGGSPYVSSAGAGLTMTIPFNDRFALAPEFEWRRLDYKLDALTRFSAVGSGDLYTGGASSRLTITNTIRLDSRAFYRRGENASFTFQNFEQRGAEAALLIEFRPLFSEITRNWSVAPYVKYTETRFDAPNPFIDPLTTRRDNQWSVGTQFNMPFTTWFGLTTAVQYDMTNSSLPNYRLNNFSIIFGPTLRF